MINSLAVAFLAFSFYISMGMIPSWIWLPLGVCTFLYCTYIVLCLGVVVKGLKAKHTSGATDLLDRMYDDENLNDDLVHAFISAGLVFISFFLSFFIPFFNFFLMFMSVFCGVHTRIIDLYISDKYSKDISKELYDRL